MPAIRRAAPAAALVAVLVILCGAALLLWAGAALAQDAPAAPAGPAETAIATLNVAAKISYQGVLREGGVPVTGTRSFTFSFYRNPTCVLLVGSPIPVPNVAVNNGLFSAEIALGAANASIVNGQGLWVQPQVGGVKLACREVLPVPYALSLRPGAVVSGTISSGAAYNGATLALVNSQGNALWVQRNSANTNFPASRFINRANSYAVATDSQGNAVFGSGGAQTLEYGGVFAGWGGVLLRSFQTALRVLDPVSGNTWLNFDTPTALLTIGGTGQDGDLEVTNNTGAVTFQVDGQTGNTFAAGSKSAVVQTPAYGPRALYAVESPEVRFEDFGSAQLSGGAATITLDPVFAETINTAGYQVFVTPVGAWAALYVAEKSPIGFTVRAAGGDLNAQFDYRIVAKRRGYENVRLEPVAPAGAAGTAGAANATGASVPANDADSYTPPPPVDWSQYEVPPVEQPATPAEQAQPAQPGGGQP